MQQARNATMWIEDEGIEPKFLIRDRDRKYPDKFDVFWKDAKVRPIKISPRAPMAKAFYESFIGTLTRERLNHFMCFARDHLDCIVRTWLRHYHEHRPHRGVDRDNTVLGEKFMPMAKGQVRCGTELRGIIHEYYRDARKP